MNQKQQIAILIDCDNASPNSIEGVLEELAKYGMVNVRHAHGDWQSKRLSGWQEKLIPHAIRPMQQFPYTTGKNATDIALIIDAMDLLYSKSVDAFAIMTSDSDFTPLAVRIRESSFSIYGFGEEKTPEAFRAACSVFIHTEKLVSSGEKNAEATVLSSKAKTTDVEESMHLQGKNAGDLRRDAGLVKLLTTAVEQTAGDDGWSYVGTVGSYITNNSSFSSINYGYRKLGDLIRAIELFDVDMRNECTSMYVRRKTAASG